jgi:hypothetical protein
MSLIGTQAAAATGVALILAGCSPAEKTSIFRTADLGSGTTVITDAKQRVVTNVPAMGGPGRNVPKRIICAEPSPDVAQTVSDVISAALEVQIKGQGSGATSFGRSTADAVVQLGERLATIQLLRDALYRACEAYANGAVSSTTYSMIVSRYDDTMVTLLMGELAAGAFGRAGASAGTGASGAGQAGGDIDREAAMKSLNDAEEEVAKEEGELREAKTQLEKAKVPDSNNQVDQSKVEEKTAAVEKEQPDLELAKRRWANAQELVLASSAGTYPSARALFASGQGAISASEGVEAANVLAGMHETFLKYDSKDLAPLVKACITSLDAQSPHSDKELVALVKAAKDFEKATGILKKASKTEKVEAKKGYDKKRGLLHQASINAGMTNWGVYCTTTALPEVFKLAEKKLLIEELDTQKITADSIKKMMEAANKAAVKAQHAADTVVRQISTKKTKKDVVSKFCIDLVKKGAGADKDTVIACVEALGGL